MNNIIVNMQFGSHVYGTNVPTSDHDFKAVYLPSARDILLQQVRGNITTSTKQDKTAKNSTDDIDVETFSLQQYLKLLAEGQTVTLDMMFTPQSFYTDRPHRVWQEIQANRTRFFSKKSASFIGYAKTQANKYGIRGSRMGAIKEVIKVLESLPRNDKLIQWLPTIVSLSLLEHCDILPDQKGNQLFECCNRKVSLGNTVKQALEIFQKVFDNYGERTRQAMTNEGIDWKALMHAVRVGSEALEFFATGNITQPRPERELLLKIRKGELPYAEVATTIEQLLIQVEEASKVSILPELPDHQFIDDFVANVHDLIVRGLL